jgi:hypothetical protein
MILETLKEQTDDQLQDLIVRAQDLLKERDRERKDNALTEARALLASVGLSLKDVAAKAVKRTAAVTYKGGQSYRHPSKPELVWNAKGQKPGWLRELEKQGGRALEVPEPANGNAVPPKKSGSA